MDDRCFDDVARSLANPSSRRGALRLVAGAFAGSLPLIRPDGAAACAPPGRKCNPDKPRKCCSRKCSPKGTCLCTKASQCRRPPACKKAVCTRGKCKTQKKSDGVACDGGTCCGGTCCDGTCCGGACIAVGSPCEVPGKLGICADGGMGCVDGQSVCEQTRQPRAETCNGLDDDCDGATDEGQNLCSPEKVCRDGGCACAGGGRCNRDDCLCPERGFYCHTRAGENHGDCRCDPNVYCGDDCPCPASIGFVCSDATNGTCECDGTRCGTDGMVGCPCGEYPYEYTVCKDGHCVCPDHLPACGTNGLTCCLGGRACQNGACVCDDTRCGTECGCPTGKTCSGGVCECDGTRCDNGCSCFGAKTCQDGFCACDGFKCGGDCGCDEEMICSGGRCIFL